MNIRYSSNRYRDFEEVLSVLSVVPEGYVLVFTPEICCAKFISIRVLFSAMPQRSSCICDVGCFTDAEPCE